METAQQIGAVESHQFQIEGGLPFLSIETDGNPFPQILEARVEAFCLQVERFYKKRNNAQNVFDNARIRKQPKVEGTLS
jgi:hypothetical protein